MSLFLQYLRKSSPLFQVKHLHFTRLRLCVSSCCPGEFVSDPVFPSTLCAIASPRNFALHSNSKGVFRPNVDQTFTLCYFSEFDCLNASVSVSHKWPTHKLYRR